MSGGRRAVELGRKRDERLERHVPILLQLLPADDVEHAICSHQALFQSLRGTKRSSRFVVGDAAALSRLLELVFVEDDNASVGELDQVQLKIDV
jgi:hypothetical protein